MIAATSIMSFFFIYFAMKITDRNHVLLKFLLIGFAIFSMILIPKAAYDGREECTMAVHNVTVVEYSTGSTLETNYTYGYNQTCKPYPYATARSAVTLSFIATRILAWYFILALLYWLALNIGLVEKVTTLFNMRK